MIFDNANILITGAGGFLGHHVVKAFGNYKSGRVSLYTPNRHELDLLDKQRTLDWLDHYRPDVVIHLAGTVGGIGLNQCEPGRLTYENLVMGTNLIEACRQHGISKFVCIGTSCSFGANCPIPFNEQDFLEFNRNGPGMPEVTNAGYGLSKRMLYELLRTYALQYNFPFIYLIPTNLYGPYDHFDDNKSHVIPALIKKFHYAKIHNAQSVTLWGDGSPTREFLYVSDAANAICRATAIYNSVEPMNLGNGIEISIRELAECLASLIGFNGRIEWDLNRPNGQMRRCMDVSRMHTVLGKTQYTSLQEGLEHTYRWYLNQVDGHASI